MNFLETLIETSKPKSTGKTYVFGKIGKAIKFDSKKWGATGGDNEAPSLILKLAEQNPNDTFILISSNDFDKVQFNKPSNIINGLKSLGPLKNMYDGFLTDTLKDKDITGAIIVLGPTCRKNLEYWPRLGFAKSYCAPIIHYLNNSNVKWIGVCNDPRYYLKDVRDLTNKPLKYLSQYNESFVKKVFSKLPPDNDNDLIDMTINSEYSGVEKIMLFNNKTNKNFENKNNDFNIILNEGKNGVKSRYPELKKYVLNFFDDVNIYGEWYSEETKNDLRFKGPKPFTEIVDITKKSKFSFIIPISPGWVTSKYIELINNGIIPFFHPDYDSQKNLDIPDFLRIESPNQLKERIDIIKSDNDFYVKLITELQNKFITENDINGKTISDTIMREFN